MIYFKNRKTFSQRRYIKINKITIADVAQKAGVSISTASKALTGKGRISEETVKLVVDISNQLGYKPNRVAQALSRKSVKIGIIIPGDPVEVLSQIEKGLINTLQNISEFGIEYIIRKYNSKNDHSEVNKLLDKMKGAIDGLIIVPGYHLTGYIEKIRNLNIPILSLLTGIEVFTGIGCVSINETVVGKIAAEYLGISSRNKNVAIITGDKDVLIHKKNIEGFIDMGRNFGLNTLFIEESFDDMMIAYKLTKRILDANADITGIFVTSYVAPAVCKCLKEYNKQKDIQVIGMDLFEDTIRCLKDGSLNAIIYQNQFMQGKRAVEVMTEYLSGNKKIVNEKIKPELVFMSNLECYI